MTRTFRTSRLAVALGVAALAGAALAPAATAIPYEDLRSPDTVDAARAAGDRARAPPRPRSRPRPATEYQDLRSPDAVDAARAAGDPTRVVPPAASIAAFAADRVSRLCARPKAPTARPSWRQRRTCARRTRATRPPATGPTTASQPAGGHVARVGWVRLDVGGHRCGCRRGPAAGPDRRVHGHRQARPALDPDSWSEHGERLSSPPPVTSQPPRAPRRGAAP